MVDALLYKLLQASFLFRRELSVDLLVKCLSPLGALDAFHSVYEFRSEHLINRNAALLTKGKQGQERANEEWRRERGA